MNTILFPIGNRNHNPESFIDTLILYCFRPPEHEFLSRLSREYGTKFQLKPAYKRKDGGPVPWMLTLHQPSPETLEVFNEIQKQQLKVPPFVIHRVDVSTDFPCDSALEAEQVTRFLQQNHQLKHRRKSHKFGIKETTTYSNHARARRNIVIYGDKLSKATETPCAHFEIRFRGASACKAAGVGSIQSLIDGFNTLEMLKHQTKLSVIDWEKLNEIVDEWALKVIRRRVASHNADRVHTTWPSVVICRQLQTNEKPISNRHKRLLRNHKTSNRVDTTYKHNLIFRIRGLLLRNINYNLERELTWETIKSQELYDGMPILRNCLRKLEWDDFTVTPTWHQFRKGNMVNTRK